jgi:tRNA1Val (adenine37-N6)-methyltransferase
MTAEVTHDALFAGGLSLRQPARHAGYRVNVDAILLAAFAAHRLGDENGAASAMSARHAVDLGSGVGAVGLTLLHLSAAARVTMVEIDASLARLARGNAEDNGWADRVDVIHASVSDASEDLRGEADLVVCNPPYVTPGRGREPKGRVRSAKVGRLDDFLDAARCIAGRRARAAFVYPAIEATTLLTALRARGLEPKRLRPVHGRPTDKARVVLVECAAGKPGGLVLEPPLVETNADGSRSATIATLLETRRR